MDPCTKCFDQIQQLRQQCLDDRGRSELFAHLAHCEGCRGLFAVSDDVAAAAAELAEPPAPELAAMRRRVLAEIRGSTQSWVARAPHPAAPRVRRTTGSAIAARAKIARGVQTKRSPACGAAPCAPLGAW